MEYMRLSLQQQFDRMQQLASMSDFLTASFAALSRSQLSARGPNNAFAPIEQVWHLADLEKEGFHQRVTRLLHEDYPMLSDFDGTQAANDKNYLSKELRVGLAQFQHYRQLNLQLFAQLSESQWRRRGTLDGFGEVSLCDMPGFLFQHDNAHKQEIVAWQYWHRNNHIGMSD